MREIKFRAWDEEAEHMVYATEDDYAMGIDSADGKFKAWRIFEAPATFDEPPHADAEEMDAIMQFTGLLDKSGKEIYEGDVVEYGLIQFVVEMPDIYHTQHSCNSYAPARKWLNEVEVIGNIYENPELLERQ